MQTNTGSARMALFRTSADGSFIPCTKSIFEILDDVVLAHERGRQSGCSSGPLGEDPDKSTRLAPADVGDVHHVAKRPVPSRVDADRAVDATVVRPVPALLGFLRRRNWKLPSRQLPTGGLRRCRVP